MWLLKYCEVGQYDHWFELIVNQDASYVANSGNYITRPTQYGRLSPLQMAQLRNLIAGVRTSQRYPAPEDADGFYCTLELHQTRPIQLSWWHRPPDNQRPLSALHAFIKTLP